MTDHPDLALCAPDASGASHASGASGAFAGIDGEVRRILVLRALVLGDTMCAVPALRAVRRAWPRAHIALMGLPVAREYLSRLDCVDEWLPFPGWPGLPERPADVRELPAFLTAMQASDWDLAIQLHGSGELTNPLLALLGARHNAGFHGPGAWVPPADAGRFAPWPMLGHETQRLLSLCRHLGLPVEEEALEFPLRDEDEVALRHAWPGRDRARPATRTDPDPGDGDGNDHQAGEGGYACLHVGAQLPSRRWPLRRFAAVGQALHDAGLTVVLSGTAGERAMTGQLSAMLGAVGVPCVDLAGATTLWSLGALLRGARVLVCNDTGVSHIAAALRVPSVVVSCGSEPMRWAPSDRTLHRVLAKPAPCRPCAYAECPNGHACAHALSVLEVLQALEDLLRQPRVGLGSVGSDAGASSSSSSSSPDASPTSKEGPHVPPPAHPDVARPRQLLVQPHAGTA
ncbi:glycosyltransferase family 9 protein [Roseateles sp.]|uniref:glycosyltransferase family 9 protein n=1 Tax=Roseateles sp. TaxID=1971397 RepID=UPI0031DCF99D